MVDISGRDELVELAGKGDRDGSGSQDISSKMRQAILARARARRDKSSSRTRTSDRGRVPRLGAQGVVAVVRGDQLVVEHRGLAGVLSRRGVAVEMSRDHKPMDDDARARIMKAAPAAGGRDRAPRALSRHRGSMEYKQGKSLPPQDQIVTAYPELMEQTLREGDEFLVLACDGIWTCSARSSAWFVRRASTRTSISKICEDLADECMAPDTKEAASAAITCPW